MLALYLVIRIVANPVSNVFQKLLTRDGADPLFVIGAVHTILAVVCLPILLADFPELPAEFWLIMLAGAVLTVSGNVLIVLALRQADLSILGPINSYKAVVSLLPGLILLGEIPSSISLLGIALIVAGSWFLGEKKGSETRPSFAMLRSRGVQLRLAALVISALEAAVMKRAMLLGTAWPTFAAWSIFGSAVALMAVLVTRSKAQFGKQSHLARKRWPRYLALTISTGLMQGCTIFLFYRFEIAAALALFQLSTIVSVLLGWQVFRERDVLQRLFGATVMAVGAMLIIV